MDAEQHQKERERAAASDQTLSAACMMLQALGL
jgi:hypothetical protein